MNFWGTVKSGFFNAAKQVNDFAQEHPYLVNALVIATLVPLATASDLCNFEEMGLSLREVCTELLSYKNMCDTFNLLNVDVEGPINIMDAAGSLLARANGGIADIACGAQEMIESLCPNIASLCAKMTPVFSGF